MDYYYIPPGYSYIIKYKILTPLALYIIVQQLTEYYFSLQNLLVLLFHIIEYYSQGLYYIILYSKYNFYQVHRTAWRVHRICIITHIATLCLPTKFKVKWSIPLGGVWLHRIVFLIPTLKLLKSAVKWMRTMGNSEEN